jgi:lipoprotein-anchoring transpeptidase ErfK/SrfK
MNRIKLFLLSALLIIPSAFCFGNVGEPDSVRLQSIKCRKNKGKWIVVSKEKMTLFLYDSKDELILAYPIACGKAYGDKQRPGDNKTPEGKFEVSQTQDASWWEHDFGDGKGSIKNAYGPYFIRLKTPPHKGIGIHGTHKPLSIGKRDTEGCIRLKNEDLEQLFKHVYIGMPVTIEADPR